MVTAQIRQVPTGEIPPSGQHSLQKTAPTGAIVVDLQTHDLNFYPSSFSVQPGTQVAVHIVSVSDKGVGIPAAVGGIHEPCVLSESQRSSKRYRHTSCAAGA